MKAKSIYTALIMCLLFIFTYQTAFADIAPPLQPSGANPGMLEFEETKVELFYENVQIMIGDESTLYYSDKDFKTVNAHVKALFIMVNRGAETEIIDTVFPLTNFEGYGDGRFNFPELQNFKVSVDEADVPWKEVATQNPSRAEDPPIKWAQFTVEYPPEDNVIIVVEYDVQSSGYLPEATFSYILFTGAGWFGPINEAHIYLNLPYEASRENVLIGKYFFEEAVDDPEFEGKFEGKNVHWEYYDIEPETNDNWSVRILTPLLWQEVLNLRQRIEEGDALAYAEITSLYDEIIFERPIRPGAESFIQLNLDAYQKAAQFEPRNDDLLARYADFQLQLVDIKFPGLDKEISLEEIYLPAARALEVNPDNELAAYVIRVLENLHNYQYQSPTPTTTVELIEGMGAGTKSEKTNSRNEYPKTFIYGAITGSMLAVLVFYLIRKRR